VNVDVPSFRARFLSLYYQRYLRPAKDHLVGNIESMAPVLANVPKFVNFFQNQPWLKAIIKATIGYVDAPLLSSPTLKQHLQEQALENFDLQSLSLLSDEQKRKKVFIVQDPFTSFYEADLVRDFVELVQVLGMQPIVLPFKPNGKPQHVKGFLDKFAKTAQTSADFLNSIAQLGIPMVGMDASLVLCYRDEYNKALGTSRGDFEVLLAHEWLQQLELPTINRIENTASSEQEYALFAHCTEKTALPVSEKQWQSIFAKMGLKLSSIAVGCCGMAGTFGHEASHLEESKGIYQLSWEDAISQLKPEQILATGYSCRSQVSRFEQFKPLHPLQLLLRELQLAQKSKDG
jgi:Fe-S oxidoreductase